MAESVSAAVLARLRRDHRLAILPLSAKAMWLQLALHATQTEDGVLAIGTPYGWQAGVAILSQCAEAEVKQNLDILIAAGFVRPLADAAIRILGLGEPPVASQAPLPPEVVPAAITAPPAPPTHRFQANGRNGGRPRKGETPEQAYQRRQPGIMLPVSGGKPTETKIETKETKKVAENRHFPETKGESWFSWFPRAEVEEKKKENQTPTTPSYTSISTPTLENQETKKNQETQKPTTKPVDQEEAMRIASEIGKRIRIPIRPNDKNIAFVRGWMMEGISERTIMRAVSEGIEAFEGSIGSIKFFDGRVRQAHASRDPDEDLPPEARSALRGAMNDYMRLNVDLMLRLNKGTVAQRSKREMALSFKFDDVFARWDRPLLTFVDRAEYDHWKGVWERGEWVSPYEDERAA